MQFIETSIFTRQVTALLADDDYRQLQAALSARPDAGSIIPHSGGLRKMRWAMAGRGKRGGGGVQMKDEMFEELVTSLREGGEILRGRKAAARTFVIEAPDVKEIRAGFKLTQNEFAALMGISVKTLRNWEQGRRSPEGAARVLMQVAAKHPGVIWDVVRAKSSG